MKRLKDGGARLALIGAIGIVSLLVPASAGADLPAPGPNGQIAFASGRDDGSTVLSDATAQIWLLDTPGGTPTRLTTTTDTLHHRHPAWSPDHTKLVYAEGPSGFAGPWDLIVHDFQTGTNDNITDTDPAGSVDRAAWSPDGTRIVYQKTDSGGNTDVMVRPADGTGSETLVADNAETGAGAESKFTRPHWTPDSQTIFYAKLFGPGDHDIYKAPANGSNTTGTFVVAPTANDYQPEVSPDGTQICFTRETSGTTKDLRLASIAGAVDPTVFVTGGQNFECAWSPDQTKIAWSNGAFGAGMILMRNTTTPANQTTVAQDAGAARFDGNPDWAINFRPACQNATVNVAVNGFLSIPLGCTDRDISDNKFISREIVSPPGHGNLGSIDDNTDSVFYTPAKDFKGTDTFTFKGSDGNSESSPATITVEVGKTTGGKDVTPAKIDKVVSSNKTWRRGSALPSVLSRAKVGTVISYRLSENARVTFTFSRKTTGRKVGKRCRKTTRTNRKRRRCTRYVKAGTLQFNGKAGTNRVKFQGRLSRRKRLALGRYRLVVGARDAAGNVSKNAAPVSFRIVKR
jgi:Tol biopolymer transport system component